MKPWQRIVGARPNGIGGAPPGLPPEPSGDARGAFGDLRASLEPELRREIGSPLLVRASFELLVGAFVTRAQQSREAMGLVAFELDDWKLIHERAGESAFADAFAGFGQELRRRLRASDELGRLGEAQIVAVLPGCEAVSLDSVAHRLRMALEARDLTFCGEVMRPLITTAWLAAPSAPAPASPARLLEELETALERARGAAPS
ncbi:MAG: GGDEF domain-containing protein [Myxococcota bacterium]